MFLKTDNYTDKNNNLLNNLRAIALIAVVIGHFISYSAGSSALSPLFKGIYIIIWSFHMPLLILLEGAFFDEKAVAKTAYTYFVLYFLQKLLIYAENVLMGKSASFGLFTESGVPWIFFAFAAYPLIMLLLKKLPAKVVLIMSFVVGMMVVFDSTVGDLFVASRILVFFTVYLLGYTFRDLIISKDLTEVKTKKSFAAGMAFLVIWVVICLIRSEAVYSLRPWLTGRNTFEDLRLFPGIATRILCYVISLAVIIALFAVSSGKKIPVFTKIGENALGVYFWHILIVRFLIYSMHINDDLVTTPVNKAVYVLVGAVVAVILSVDLINKPVKMLVLACDNFSDFNGDEYFINWKKQIKANIKSNGKVIVFSAVAFSMTFLLCAPLYLFFPNSEEFWFSLGDLLLPVILSALVGVIAIILAGILQHTDNASSNVAALMIGITLAMYVQGIINIKYGSGVLDGSEINWSEYWWYAIIDTIVWAACIAVPFVLKKKYKDWKNYLCYGAVFLVLIQMSALVVQAMQYKPNSNNELLISNKYMYELSSDQNMVFIILDTLDYKYYQEFISDNPTYTENLTGFTSYDNTLASGARTVLGLPSMLSGTPFLNEGSYSDYISGIWTNDNVMSRLHADDVNVGIYSETTYFTNEAAEYIDNFDNAKPQVASSAKLGEKIYKLAAFTYFPHILKPACLINGTEFNEAKDDKGLYSENDARFFNGFTSNNGFDISDKYDKALRVYHLSGAHSPYVLDSKGKKVSESTLEDQVAGCFYQIKGILDDMKEKNVYDSSCIVITTDHGELHECEHSTFLMKPVGSTGEYSVSGVPVSSFDFPILMSDFFNIGQIDTIYGMKLSELSEDTQRTRHFFKNARNSMALQVDEYITEDDVNNQESLQLIKQYSKEKATSYTFGEKLTFDVNATANDFAKEGIVATTGFQSVFRGPVSEMSFPVDGESFNGKDTLIVRVATGSTKNFNDGLPMEIYVNDYLAFSGQVEASKSNSTASYEVPIDAIGRDASEITVTWKFPTLEESELEEEITKRTKTMSLKSITLDLK